MTERFHDEVRVTVDDGCAHLVMEQGEGANTFTPVKVDAMTDALRAAEAADCVLLRGEGQFSVGADLQTFGAASPAERTDLVRETVAASNRFIRAVRETDRLVVAGIEGAAAGGGLGFALACDLLVMAEDAVLDTAYARIGLTPDNGTPYFLARALGPYRARELLFDPEPVSGAEAQDLGLVATVIADSEGAFVEGAAAFARRHARLPAGARGMTKALVDSAFEEGLDAHLERQRERVVAASRTDGFAEGLAAFLAHREPDW